MQCHVARHGGWMPRRNTTTAATHNTLVAHMLVDVVLLWYFCADSNRINMHLGNVEYIALK